TKNQMNLFKRISNFALLFVLAVSAFGQLNTITQTTTTATVTASQTVIPLTSVTGVNAPSITSQTQGSLLYVADVGNYQGEAMRVVSISSLNVTVRRGTDGTKAVAHT